MTMDKHDYYAGVFKRLERSFDHAGWVLGYGLELIKRGWDPDKLLVTVEPVDHLRSLAIDQGLEVFIPVFGKNGSVMAPIDYEIFLSHEGYKLYSDPGSQWHYHQRHIKPVTDFFETTLRSHQVPYFLDLTPSGGHILFHAEPGSNAYSALASIGWLEEELVNAYAVEDPNDLKRNPPPGFEAGSVFSGIGRLWHYVSLQAKHAFLEDNLPVTICDSENKCVNLDNSWQADAGYMRIMRAPFSLHAKNIHRFNMGETPLVDIAKTRFDGLTLTTFDDLEDLVRSMWNFERAIEHANAFDGSIPVVGDTILPLIEEYKKTRLCEFIERFDRTPTLGPGEALHRAHNDHRISWKTRDVLRIPYPRLLQPTNIKKFVHDLVIHCGWDPKHVGCLINDLYGQPQHHWKTDWNKYPSRTRANYWARTYSSVILLEQGEHLLQPRSA